MTTIRSLSLRGGSLQLLLNATSSPTPVLGEQRRWIIVPRQLKAYGGSFSPSIGERNADVASHLVLQSLTSPTRLKQSPLLRKPVKTSCVESFEEMCLVKELRDALKSCDLQVTTPSPIQQSAIEVLLQRKSAVVAAPHGEGKTLATLLPLFQHMMHDRDVYRIPLRERRPRMLLLAPTRELVDQLHRMCELLGAFTGLTSISFTSRPRSKYHLSRLLKQMTADIIVMDPKTILRLIRARRLFLDDLRYVAVDEADVQLTSSHDNDVAQLLAKVRKRNLYQHLWPVQTQYVFTTAYMTRAVEHYVGKRVPDVVTCMFPKAMHRPPPSLSHKFYPTKQEEKMTVLCYYLYQLGHRPDTSRTAGGASTLKGSLNDFREALHQAVQERAMGRGMKEDQLLLPSAKASSALQPGEASPPTLEGEEASWTSYAQDTTLRTVLESIQPLHWHHLTTTAGPFTGGSVRRSVFAPGRRTMIFMQHIDAATAIYHRLQNDGYAVSLLHAALPASVRRRMYADFSSGRTNILCTTDVAARGLDVHVDVVINFDMPTNALTYLSRVGRASRMGRTGTAISFYTKFQGTIVGAIKTFVDQGIPLEGVSNRVKDMTTPRYAEWRTHKINALSRAYVSMLTSRVIPAHLERSYVHHNATWRPPFHPQTTGVHGGVPPRRQQRLMDRIRSQAVWFRRGQLGRRKGGRAKFGRRSMKSGVWNDVGGVASRAVANEAQSPSPGGVGLPSGPQAMR